MGLEFLIMVGFGTIAGFSAGYSIATKQSHKQILETVEFNMFLIKHVLKEELND